MLKWISLALVGVAFVPDAAGGGQPPDSVAIATAANRAMTETGAKGLAIAVIDQGRVVSVRAFGARNAKGDPLTTDTIMYAASITKTVFAHLVLQLVDAKRLDLDRPIAALLPKALPAYGNPDAYGNWGDLAGDARWRAITPRMALTHSTGFANFAFVEPDRKLRIHFAPGSRYAYSGEGIMLLQFALDQGLNLATGAELQRRIFEPLGMKSTSLRWRPEFAANLADGWKADGGVEPHDERSLVRAAGSMDTSIADLAKFAAALVGGDLLTPASRAELVKPTLPITTASQFPTLQPELPPGERIKGLAAGLGVIVFEGPQGSGFFKGGHNDSTGNSLVCLDKERRCALMMANDVRAEAAFPGLVRAILGETGVPYRWEYPDLKAW